MDGRQGGADGPPASTTGASPPSIAPEGEVLPAVRLATLLAQLKAPGPEGDPSAAARTGLLRLLEMRFGPGLEGACLDRDWLAGAIDREIAAIDGLLTEQMNAILHTPRFQRLEGRWRGLAYLTLALDENNSRAKLRLLSATWTEVVRDLERASDFDQSDLFDKIYSTEFGMPGGEPFGLIIGDYEVQHRSTADHPTDDIGAIKSLAMVGAAAFCPFVLGLSPRVLQLDSFRDLGRPLNLRTIFAQAEYQRWLGVRDGDDTRFVGLAMPRIIMRHPYRLDTRRPDGFPFQESTDDKSGEGHLWANAAFAFAAVVIRAFLQSGWFADLRGAPRDEVRGGLVTNLPVISFDTDRPGLAIKPSTECMLSDDHETQLADLGIIALRKMPFTDFSVFYANPSIQAPTVYDRTLATANARLSSMLQYVLCVSRFSHYIKVMTRDRVGSMVTAQECQSTLEKWLRQYVEGNETATQAAKAQRPLRAASVEVRDAPGKPGSFACTVYMRPHFQLDDVATGFRLTTELAPLAAA
jgi:type VI secretion system protein ImpD